MSDTADFVVIGGGIAGASAAHALAEHGRTVLIEREPYAGYHSTGRSGAVFLQGYGNSVVGELNRASAAFLAQPPAGFAAGPLTAPLGVLYVAVAGGGEALDRLSATLAAAGIAHVREDADAAHARIEVIDPAAIDGALYEPSARSIDVDLMLHAYLRGLRARGGEFVTGADAVAAATGGGSWRVTAGARTICCGCVIDAAGAWADELATRCGVAPLGLAPMRRTALVIDLPAAIDPAGWPLVLDVDERFYFKPEAGRLLVSPAEETPVEPHDAFAEELDIAVAIDRLQQVTTLQIDRIRHSWAGLRTFARDRTPVAGFDPDHAGFFWLAGQGGYGIQTAPAMARLCAQLVTTGRPPVDLAAAAPLLAPQRLR